MERISPDPASLSTAQGLMGRYYEGRPIMCEFSPVTDFREATCRQYEENTCTRGGYCNFMHLRPISRSPPISPSCPFFSFSWPCHTYREPHSLCCCTCFSWPCHTNREPHSLCCCTCCQICIACLFNWDPPSKL